MTQLLFRNRWFALIWALAICFSISRFFDAGGGQEQLAEAAKDIRSKRVEAARQEANMRAELEENQVVRGRPEDEGATLTIDNSYVPRSDSESSDY